MRRKEHNIMTQMKPDTNLQNEFTDIEKIVYEGVESVLDEADRIAVEHKVRLSHKEVFDNLKSKING